MADEQTLTETPQDTPEVMADSLFKKLAQRIESFDLAGLFRAKANHDAPFQVVKTPKGYRWVAAFSNNFEDRDEEIISEKAWDGYLQRVNAGFVPMPELWIGHIKGTRHGIADMVFGAGNFVVATGSFDDTPIAAEAIKYYTSKEGRDVPLSHGFTFPKWAFKNGIYEVVNTFEITTLPPPLVASNPYTEYEVFDSMKQIDPNQRAALKNMLGATADDILANLEKGSEALKDAGVAFKAFTDAEPVVTTPTANEPMAALLDQLVTAQGDMAKMLTDALTRMEGDKTKALGLNTRLDQIESKLASVQAELDRTPKAASSATETKLSDKEAENVKKDFSVEYDPAFGDMKVPLKR